jgi:hypothetical protein
MCRKPSSQHPHFGPSLKSKWRLPSRCRLDCSEDPVSILWTRGPFYRPRIRGLWISSTVLQKQFLTFATWAGQKSGFLSLSYVVQDFLFSCPGSLLIRPRPRFYSICHRKCLKWLNIKRKVICFLWFPDWCIPSFFITVRGLGPSCRGVSSWLQTRLRISQTCPFLTGHFH